MPIQCENTATHTDSTLDLNLVFSVVWGKISTKKHKTYEGDGTLTVSDKTATLRNINGSYLGSRTIKPEEIEIGSRLIIGSNEVEIIERTTELPLKQKIDENVAAQSSRYSDLQSTSISGKLIV